MLAELQQEGKILHIGLSQVSVDELREVASTIPVASVQNRFNLLDRRYESVLEACEAMNAAFIPWAPLEAGSKALEMALPATLVTEIGATPRQIAISWLLHRAPNVVPIPGTSSLSHLRENLAAARLLLTPRQMEELDRVESPTDRLPVPIRRILNWLRRQVNR